MAFGSWLGSLRHHGLIPWDEDFDFLLDLDKKEKISEIFSTKLPEPCQIRMARKLWRLSAKNASAPTQTCTFPYIDIYFYTDRDGIFRNRHAFQVDRNQVFPLQRRPFFDMCVPVPRNSTIGMSADEANTCTSRAQSHKTWHTMDKQSVQCDVMHQHYPFVFRTPVNSSWTNETLIMNGTLLHWVLVKN